MKYFHYIILALCMAFVSCGDDADNNLTPSDNINANNTEKSIYALRTEMPHVDKGNNFVVLENTTSSIGVNFIVLWDRFNKTQRWSCWEWNSNNSDKHWDRKNWLSEINTNQWARLQYDKTKNYKDPYADPFQPDFRIDNGTCPSLNDYAGSGFNRGHICASEDRIYDKDVNEQTFLLTNMQPQYSSFNSGVWSNMESKLRTWRDATKKNSGILYVCKGGTYGDVFLDGKTVSGNLGTFGKNKLPIPRYFFMAVLKKTAAGTYSGMAFWAEHKSDASTNLTPYMISIDELERRTGYDFFCNLSDKLEDTVESMLVTSDWK